MGGKFSLTQRLFSLPVALIGQSVAQLFLPIMARAFHSSSRQAYDLFLRITGVLAVPSFLLAGGLVFLDWDWLVAFLGEDWRGLQAFVKPLAFLMVMQILVSTVSQTAIVLGGQRWYFVWVVSWVTLSFTGLWLGHWWGDAVGAVWGMALAKGLMYAILWGCMLFVLLNTRRRHEI
jgi:O-antigen/teichoic acid export membrane protein